MDDVELAPFMQRVARQKQVMCKAYKDLQTPYSIMSIIQFIGSNQALIYCVYYSKKQDSMPHNNTMKILYFPSKEMAEAVYDTLAYFMTHWDKGYDGGELFHGVKRVVCTQIDDDRLVENSTGNIVSIASITNNFNLLAPLKRNFPLEKHVYDEYMLAVLRMTGFAPRIEKCKCIKLFPFLYSYKETDEVTVGKMGLVLNG